MSPLLSSPGRSIKLIEGYGTSTLGQGFGSSGGGAGSYLGDTASNFATSAQAILDVNPERTGMNGLYWIKTTGMASAAQIFCDMTSGCQAWMRFWWYGKYELDGTQPASNGSVWQGGAQFNVADISTINYDVWHCRGRIPSGYSINGIMAKGITSLNNSADNTQISMGQSMSAVWWDSGVSGWSGNVGGWMRDAMQNGNTMSGGSGTRIEPRGCCMSNPNEPLNANNCDSWFYDNSGNRFNLDDDTGFHKTIFAAGTGLGGGGTGVDFCTNDVDVNYSNQLALYFR